MKDLTVRVLEAHEYERAGELLDQEHYLGDLRTGRALLQAVEYFPARWPSTGSGFATGAPVAVDFAANKPKSEAHRRIAPL